MAKLKVLIAPDPKLRVIAKPVDTIDNSILDIFDNMVETMEDNAGLAATQVGINKRIIIMAIPLVDHNYKEMDESLRTPYHDKLLKIINPEITARSDEKIICEEGCLSIPGQYVNVERNESIDIKFTDETGKDHNFTAAGLLAICFQHEIDHLNGKLSIDHLPSKLKRDIVLRKMRRFIVSNEAEN